MIREICYQYWILKQYTNISYYLSFPYIYSQVDSIINVITKEVIILPA